MKMKLCACLVVFLLSCIGSAAQFHNLSGKVINSVSSTNINGTILVLNYKKKQQISDANGNFLFDSLPPGPYTITAYHAGYPVQQLSVLISDKIHNNVVIEMNPPCEYDKNRNDNTCPVCHKKENVVPVRYGLPVGKMDTTRYYYAGCEVTFCDPSWYCKRDKKLF